MCFKWHRVVAGGFALDRNQMHKWWLGVRTRPAKSRPLCVGETAPSVITDMMAGDSWGAGGDMKVDLTEKVGL